MLHIDPHILTVPSKNNSTPNSLSHLERETRKKNLTSWSYSRKTWKLRSLLSTGWEAIRCRKISCDETVFLKTARYSLQGNNRLRSSLYYLLQYTKNCFKFIPWKYSAADFWNSQLVIVKLLSISLARKFSSLKAGKAGQLPISRIFKTPFKTVTLKISYHQMSCSPRRFP